jgi:hypothetical protein
LLYAGDKNFCPLHGNDDMRRRKSIFIFFGGNAMPSINGRGIGAEQYDKARGAETKFVSNVMKYMQGE